MAKQSENTSNINQEYNRAASGLNLDSSQNNIKKGSLSYALNANLENYNSNSVNYQNEPGNELCFEFPEGYKLIGRHFIPEQNKIIFMLANPETSGSEIGFMVSNNCKYQKLVNSDCLNFSISSPIHRMVHRVTNFGIEIYWADNNGRRYLNIDDIPYLATALSEDCDVQYSSELDCNKLSLQPNINIPFLEISNVLSGGEITSGTYQFAAQYSDAVGNPYTSFYGVTNPVPIADTNLTTVNYNYPVGKSIVVDINNLDPLGQFQYFNLAVISTNNNISKFEIVGTYFIDENFKKITYTGQNVTNLKISANDIFERFVYYDNADYVTAVQDILVWKGMTSTERLNYQLIANDIDLKWQSYRLPATESYKDEVNAANYRGYLRDEVYAYEIVFILASGKETDGFHIPGRKKNTTDIIAPRIESTNPDFIGNPEEGTTSKDYWKVYNTASIENTSSEFVSTESYKGPYQYGEFAYWESEEEYPCDPSVWGELSGQKIRHHKMPDILVSPMIEGSDNTSLVMESVATYPLGVKIDTTQVTSIIGVSNLTKKQKEDIIGYRIIRADRGVNKSIVAKGMLRNVGKYKKDDQNFFYPNYPYNDLKEDPFISSVNNAWTEECEEYTIEVLSIPEQPDGESYIEIEFINCNTNKSETRKIVEIGLYKQCSISKPKFISVVGIYNVMVHQVVSELAAAVLPWEDNTSYIATERVFPTRRKATDAVIYASNYDVYKIYMDRDNAGMRVGWVDIVEGEQTKWVKKNEVMFVKVEAGDKPYCRDNTCWTDRDKYKFRTVLEKKIEVEACKITEPIIIIEEDESLASRQIFNSPETSFGQPFLGDILKLESVMYGAGKAHFVEVKDNAKYKLLTKDAQEDALKSAEQVGALTGTFSTEAMFSVYNSYLTIYINGITRKNYGHSFNSIASYNYTKDIPNELGIKQRNLSIKRYLISGVLSVGEEDDIIINNYQRESSVFLKTEGETNLPYPHLSKNMLNTGIEDRSRFLISNTLEGSSNCNAPEKEEDINVVSYYASLKNEFINQYGQIYSYDTVDTGFVKLFNNLELNEDIIFGGDTFIGKFAYKTKLPFFIDNRVNAPDDSDIFYDEIGNIGYPKYWHSARSVLETYRGRRSGLILTNFISYKAHNFDCPNSQELFPDEDADPDTNPNRTFYDGYMYMFSYGVPSFYCESSYNLDLRQAFNNKEGEFFPHVSSGIPDEWFQETNVSILNDNTYTYNVTFSKQNRESVFTNLPADWGDVSQRTYYPFRAVYSDKQNTDADNRINNWLTYRALSKFDFPQNYGQLVALDGLKNAAILARFENKSLLYNSLITIDTSNPQAAYVGNPNLFSNQPIDFAETDQGYVGTQNKMLLKIPQGAISIDAKRGQIFLITSNQAQDLTAFGSGMNRWFTAHLPFEILKHFPETEIIVDEEKTIISGVDTDNHFNGVGLHGVYDSNYDRVIITKLDYIPLKDDITFRDNKYYIIERDLEKEIYLEDSDYFCNVSWTVSFNFNSKSWVSFHSYLPNWYVGEDNFFYSGLNSCPNDFDALVGVIDADLPTTTTTTTRVVITTTTTTTLEVKPLCDFDLAIEIPDCDLEGEAVFIGDPIVNPCVRPENLIIKKFISGYILLNPAGTYDSTISLDTVCTNQSYYTNDNGDGNYTAVIQGVWTIDCVLNAPIYLNNGTNDCSTLPDGWYFTDESSVLQEAYYISNGVITETGTCGIEITSTTTTTTTAAPVTTTLCITGQYSVGDPLHPLGGSFTYIGIEGRESVINNIYDTDTITVTYISVISAVGVAICP